MSALQDKMKHTIEIEGLPEGWEPVAFRCPKDGESYVGYDGKVIISLSTNDLHGPRLIVKKKQPRRIVLEETGEERSVSYGEWLEYEDGLISQWPDEKYGSNISYKVWREVKGTEEPKLSLSVGDVKRILSNTLYCEDIVNRMREFLKEN